MKPPIVLFYHQVVRQARPEHFFFRQSLPLDAFRTAMTYVREHYHLITMAELIASFECGYSLPRRAVMITFDDGFKNNIWAAQVLRDLGMSATFFVLTDTIDSNFKPWYLRFAQIMSTRKRDTCASPWGFVDFNQELARRRWLHRAKEHLLSLESSFRDDTLDALGEALASEPIDPSDPDYQFLGSSDLRELTALGMTIGGHSASHDNLARLDAARLEREMVMSADRLSQIIGVPVETMSYPDGRYNCAVTECARKRFKMAFSASCFASKKCRFLYPRRNADGCRHVDHVLSPWYPVRRRAVLAIKSLIMSAAFKTDK